LQTTGDSTMARKPKKITISSLKKKAPKIPPLTCISIDNVISKLEKIVDKKKTLDKKQLKDLTKRLEKLREANEKLRDGGIYWYEKLKHLLKTR
tara:strand:- start:347 stop:628 length:282 start_codon:yes stop_codon:yes gene_type:complete